MIISTAVKKALTTVLSLMLAMGFGVGLVFGVKACRDKEAREEVLSKPALIENQAQTDSQSVLVSTRTIEYRDAASGFRSSAAVTLRNPTTTPQARETIKKGQDAVDKSDSLIRAKDSLVKLKDNRIELLTEAAIRAQRGKFLQVHAAVGYAPYVSAPAARIGVNMNITKHWGLTATKDLAMKYRMGNGNPKTEWLTTDFIGVNYRF